MSVNRIKKDCNKLPRRGFTQDLKLIPYFACYPNSVTLSWRTVLTVTQGLVSRDPCFTNTNQFRQSKFTKPLRVLAPPPPWASITTLQLPFNHTVARQNSSASIKLDIDAESIPTSRDSGKECESATFLSPVPTPTSSFTGGRNVAGEWTAIDNEFMPWLFVHLALERGLFVYFSCTC